jgi:AAHS family 4-hydroxybenzoate transporter-like MFS transporter
MPPPPADVGRILDDGRWGAYQKWLVFLTALTIVFDGIDNQLLGISIPSIMSDWGVTRGAFAPVVALGFSGMMIGGAGAGLVGDRYGRKVALLGCMIIFGAATLAASMAGNTAALGALRFLAGLGLGGAMPNATALAAEYVPARQRALAVTLTIVCVPLGGTLAGLMAIRLLPAVGWRTLFALGGIVPVIAALVLWRALPESPRYLARHPTRWPELRSLLARFGHTVEAATQFADRSDTPVTRLGLRAIFNREFRADTFALWAAFFSCLLSVYLGFSWLPSVLATSGLPATLGATAITVFNLGGVAGAILGGVLIVRFGSRRTMLGMAAAAVVCAGILSLMPLTATSSIPPIIVLLTLTGAMINAVQTTMFALAAHVYPTVIRARGVGIAVAIGRGGAILSGYAGPWALEAGGSASFFALMSVAVAVTFVALALVRRHVPARAPRTLIFERQP